MIDFTSKLKTLVCGTIFAACLPAMASEGTLAIEVSDVSSMDAVVTITPSQGDISYYWNFADKETFLANGGAEKAIENRIAVWERLASYYDNTTWQEMMGYELQYGTQTNSIADFFYETLMFATDYVVYGFGMDPEGNVTAPVVTAEFTTTSPETSDNTFEVTIKSLEKGGFYYSATANIQPSNDDRYMVRFFTKDFVDKFKITPGSTGEKRFIAEEMLYYPKPEEMANGPKDFTYTRCMEGEQYYVVVMGINDDMTPSTSLTLAEFTVSLPEPQGTIELEVSDITPMNARIRIVPSDDEMLYYYGITTPEIIENKGGVENIPDRLIIDWWKYLAEIYGSSYKWQDFIPYQTTSGILDDTVANLVENGELEDLYWNQDWVLYAVGFDLDGNVVTKPAVLEFSTPDCGKSDLTFKFEFVGKELDPSYPNTTRKYYIAEVDVYPSNDEETYRGKYMEYKYFGQYLDDPEPDMFDFITRQFLPYSVEFTGPVRMRIPGLAATDYYGDLIEWSVFALGWNEGPTTEMNYFKFNLDDTTGVEAIENDGLTFKTDNGSISIEGNYDHAAVFGLDGKTAGVMHPGISVAVPGGLYIIKYTTLDGTEHTRKVVVK